MNIEPVPWMSNREVCACDFDMQEYIEKENWQYKNIFLLGPGYDHLLGKKAAPRSNFILSLTHSPGELCSYMSWAIENPIQATYYQCMFGDIHNFHHSKFAPRYDIACLFHLGEKPNTQGNTTEEVIRSFYGAELLTFYTGSFAWPELAPVVARSGAEFVEQYKSIAIYRWK